MTADEPIELGCGFNPKASLYTIYPAGPNPPGALHFGIDLTKPNDYIRKSMPELEKPSVHMDLVIFESTVTATNTTIIDKRFLSTLKTPSVMELASCFSDAMDLLENWPD